MLAPNFTALTNNGELLELAKLRGQTVVLYFYPQADTPACTTQACGFRDSIAAFQAHNAVVLGISPDQPSALAAFRDKYHLPFPLLADPDLHIHHLYGVYGEKKIMGHTVVGVRRTTFIIDSTGNIHHIFRNVRTPGHSQRVLAALPPTPTVENPI